MTKKIFNAIWIVTISVLLIVSIIFLGVLYNYFTTIQQDQLRVETDMVAQGVSVQGQDYFNQVDLKDVRITWIENDGNVIYDNQSDSLEMENHLAREEIKEALEKGTGESSRYSTTLTERYFYCAEKLDDGTIIRLSVSENSIISLLLGMLHPLCFIIFVALGLSILLASKVSKNIIKPLNELNLEEPLENREYDELAPLLRRISQQQGEIRQQETVLKQKNQEFKSVTSGMREGILLLNKDLNLLSMNTAAEKILDINSESIGSFFIEVYRNPKIQKLLKEGAKGIYGEVVSEIRDKTYQFNANPVTSDGEVYGIALLIFDVTEKQELEQMRREFTANVSHELKTPLQTISGCAELMSAGMVKGEDMPGFSKQIYTEAQRMIRLIEDIIQLSKLDEGMENTEFEKTDIYNISEEVIKRLSQKAEKNHVKLTLSGEHQIIEGIPGLLFEIIYNLADNGIKYNREDGVVNISISAVNKKVVLNVSDNGIGIPKEHQERIFERFYRVDKSHSKETGGTGLGLSIVKHTVKLHKGTIGLESEEGKGTSVTVTFPVSE